MSTLRTDTLQTTDSAFTVNIEDLVGLFQPGAAQLLAGGLPVVANIAALRAYDSTKPAKDANVAGYYVEGDGGGGTYYYDAADVTSVDNGGTIIVAVDGARWKLQHSGRVSLKQFGALGNDLSSDATTNATAIQNAFDSGVPLYIPAGTYQLALTRNITLEAGATVCSLFLRDKLNLLGDGMGRSIFKLRDNESTDASPKFFNLMASNQALTYVLIKGMTFDINGANNKISPNRGTNVFNPYNCAAFMVSGSVATGGADARVSFSKILDCEFINTPGVTQVAFGQRFSHAGVKGTDVEVAGCRFYNNGIDSADHSSVYAFGDWINVHDNTFDHPVPSTGRLGPVCCVELFGSYMQAHNNRVRNYLQFCWIGQGEEGQHHHINVSNNEGSINFRGVDFWALSPQDDGVADVTIANNNFTITADPTAVAGLDRVGVNITPVNGDVFRVKITGNKFLCLDRTSNVGIVLAPTATHLLQDIDINNNSLSGFSRGIAGAGPGNNLSISVTGNDIEDCAATTARPVETRGIEFSGTNNSSSLTILANKVGSGDLGVSPKNGIDLSGTLANLHVGNNSVRASTTVLVDSVVVSGRRSGDQALLFSGLPAQSTWSIGDVATSRTKPTAGAPGSVYTLDGWSRITNGTSNVLNSDWVERRIITGT